MSDIEAGLYAYRFSGFSMDDHGMAHTIVGIGTLRLGGFKASQGRHRSTIMRLKGSNSELTHASFEVSGQYEWVEEENNWTAELRFKQLDAPSEGQVLDGSFRIVRAGESAYWLISTGAVVRNDGGEDKPANEVVEGELRKIA